MGTSMTAMLDDPEWSHLDKQSGSDKHVVLLEALMFAVNVYLVQTSNEMWTSILSWWAAGSSSSMGARRFRLSSERLSARLREREVEWREEEEEEEGDCRCRS